MSLIDELKSAAIELYGEFSQSEWEDALIEAWRKDLTLAGAVARAAKFGSGVVSAAEWEKAFRRAAELKPSIFISKTGYGSGKNLVRTWLAKNARFASDAMFDGDYDLAKRLLVKGGVRAGGAAQNKREAKREMKRDVSGRLVIKVRDRDKATDWSTCK